MSFGQNFPRPFFNRGRGDYSQRGGGFRPQGRGRGGDNRPQYGHGDSRAQYGHGDSRPQYGNGDGRSQYGEVRPRPRRNTEMEKPWVTESIRREMWKKIELGKKAKKTKSSEDFKVLADQKELVNQLTQEARVNWLALHPAEEEKWLKVLAEESVSQGTWCDVCEKGFPNQGLLDEHESEHATCGIDGCNYTAHQDVLEKHIMHQHLSGLYNKIPQGNSPEEIEKWKQERRKNFPTRDKIVAKDAEIAEKRARGEVMRLKRNKERAEQEAKDKEDGLQEPDWQCDCKARFLIRGRGGRGGRGGGQGRRNFMKNLRHQGHCKELENIRVRAKDRRESKANDRLERLKSKHEAGKENAGKENLENPRSAEVKEDEEESGSDDEGWNGGLFMFPGTEGLREGTEESETTEQQSFQISDEEDEITATTFHISDDEDDFARPLPPNSPSVIETSKTSDTNDVMIVLNDGVKKATGATSVSNDGVKQVTDTTSVSNDGVLKVTGATSVSNDGVLKVTGATSVSNDGVKKVTGATSVSNDGVKQVTDTTSVIKDGVNHKSQVPEIPQHAINDEAENLEDEDEDDDGPPEEQKISRDDPSHIDEEASELTPGGHEVKPGEEITSVTGESKAGDSDSRRRRKRKNKEDGGRRDQPAAKQPAVDVFSQHIRPPTLLERLLLDEIRRERNIILQCVRYVCNNDFLQNK